MFSESRRVDRCEPGCGPTFIIRDVLEAGRSRDPRPEAGLSFPSPIRWMLRPARGFKETGFPNLLRKSQRATCQPFSVYAISFSGQPLRTYGSTKRVLRPSLRATRAHRFSPSVVIIRPPFPMHPQAITPKCARSCDPLCRVVLHWTFR